MSELKRRGKAHKDRSTCALNTSGHLVSSMTWPAMPSTMTLYTNMASTEAKTLLGVFGLLDTVIILVGRASAPRTLACVYACQKAHAITESLCNHESESSCNQACAHKRDLLIVRIFNASEAAKRDIVLGV